MIDRQLHDLLNSWADFLSKKNLATNTSLSYLRDLEGFLSFLAGYKSCIISVAEIKQLSIQDFRAWLACRNNSSMASRSNARAISALRNFFKYLADYQNIDNAAIFNLSFPRLRKLVPHPISKQDAAKATREIANFAGSSWVGARDLSILMLLYGCGLRISEALSLRRRDIIHNADGDNNIRVFGKGSKERIVPLLPEVGCAILNYLAKCPYQATEEQPIFFGERGKALCRTYFAKRLRLFRRIFGLPEALTAHSMRHSFATHLLSAGVDIRFLQELLGHSDLASTQIYTKVENQYLLNSYLSSHPRK
ncbi:tyrosine recombinase XerC [Rickettsiales bacterium]|nr:tyrosine recombinase XerC [Rickettsiales bacterium]